MADNVIFQTGDGLSEDNLGLAANKSNSTQYVESGLSVTLNGGTIDITDGITHLQHNDRGLTVDTDARTGLSLPVSSGLNHVYLVVDLASNNSVTVETESSTASYSNPSLKIAEVDTSSSTVTELARKPDGEFNELDASQPLRITETRRNRRPQFWTGGQHFDSFENLTNWSANPGTLVAETETVFKGSQAARLSGSSGPRISNSTAAPDITDKTPSIAVHPTSNTAQSDLEIVFYCPDFSNRITYTTRVDGANTDGWYRVDFGQVEVTGSPDRTNVGNILIRQFGDTELILDDFRLVDNDFWDEPQVILSFDDSLATHMTAFDKMQEYGMPGVEGVITGSLGNAGRLTVSDCNQLQDEGGWDVISHSTNGDTLDQLSDSDARQNLKESKQVILENGWEDHTFMLPGGAYNASTLDLIQEYYSAAIGYDTSVGAALTMQPTEVGAISRTNADSLPTNQNVIDNAVAHNQLAILSFHAIGDSSQPLNISEADFQSTIDYIKNANIKVVTLSDVYDQIGLR